MVELPEEVIVKIETTLVKLLGCSYEVVDYEKTPRGYVAKIRVECEDIRAPMDVFSAVLTELEDIISKEDSEMWIEHPQKLVMILRTKPLEELFSEYE